jgi:hypothetical protein
MKTIDEIADKLEVVVIELERRYTEARGIEVTELPPEKLSPYCFCAGMLFAFGWLMEDEKVDPLIQAIGLTDLMEKFK